MLKSGVGGMQSAELSGRMLALYLMHGDIRNCCSQGIAIPLELSTIFVILWLSSEGTDIWIGKIGAGTRPQHPNCLRMYMELARNSCVSAMVSFRHFLLIFDFTQQQGYDLLCLECR